MSFVEHVRLAKARKGNNTYFPQQEESKSEGHECPKDGSSDSKSDEESDVEVLSKEDSSSSNGESDINDEVPTVKLQGYENLKPPILERWSKRSVRMFHENRQIYEAQMKCSKGGKSKIFPLRLSLGDKMRSLCCRYILRKKFEDITDKDISDVISKFLKVCNESHLLKGLYQSKFYFSTIKLTSNHK